MMCTGHIDRRAFWISLILAPFAAGIGAAMLGLMLAPFAYGLAMLGLPKDILEWLSVFALPGFGLIFGLPFYFLIGGPVLWHMLRRGHDHIVAYMVGAFLANLAAPVIIRLFDASGIASMFYLFAGSVVAPIWAMVFVLIYRHISRRSSSDQALEDVFA